MVVIVQRITAPQYYTRTQLNHLGMRPQLSGISEHVIEWNLKSDTKK